MSNDGKRWRGFTVEQGLRWAILLGLAALYCYLMRPHIAGFWYDDGIYLLGAKALATGHGYHLLSEPGAPGIVKYPPLLSMMMVPLWWLNPHFPDNLPAMKILNILFGLGGLALAHHLARRYFKLSAGAGLLLLLLIGLQSTWVMAVRDILSEPLYLLLTMLLLVLTCRIHERQSPPTRGEWLGCMALSVAAFYTRTIGITAVLGVGLWLWRQWGFKMAGRFLSISLSLCALWLAWTFQQHPIVYKVGHFYAASYNQTYLNEMMLEVMKQQGLQHVLWDNFVMLPTALLETLLPVTTQYLEHAPGVPILAVLVWASFLFFIFRFRQLRWSTVWTYASCYWLFCILWYAHDQYVRFLILISPLLWMEIFQRVNQALTTVIKPRNARLVIQVIAGILLLGSIEPLGFSHINHGDMPAINAGPELWEDFQATFKAIREFSQPTDIFWGRYNAVYPLYTERIILNRNMTPTAEVFQRNEFKTGMSAVWKMICPVLRNESVTYFMIEPRITGGQITEIVDQTNWTLMQSAPEHFSLIYTSPHGLIRIYRYQA